jgi:hypothetical protein
MFGLVYRAGSAHGPSYPRNTVKPSDSAAASHAPEPQPMSTMDVGAYSSRTIRSTGPADFMELRAFPVKNPDE